MCFKAPPCREMKVNRDFDTACMCLFACADMSPLILFLVQNTGFIFLFQMEYSTTQSLPVKLLGALTLQNKMLIAVFFNT